MSPTARTAGWESATTTISRPSLLFGDGRSMKMRGTGITEPKSTRTTDEETVKKPGTMTRACRTENLVLAKLNAEPEKTRFHEPGYRTRETGSLEAEEIIDYWPAESLGWMGLLNRASLNPKPGPISQAAGSSTSYQSTSLPKNQRQSPIPSRRPSASRCLSAPANQRHKIRALR